MGLEQIEVFFFVGKNKTLQFFSGATIEQDHKYFRNN